MCLRPHIPFQGYSLVQEDCGVGTGISLVCGVADRHLTCFRGFLLQIAPSVHAKHWGKLNIHQ